MPIPSIKSGQTEAEYVSECISALYDEYGQEQASAICYNTYRKESGMSSERLVASKINQLSKYKGIKFADAGLEDACWPDYVAIGTKDLDGREVPNCVPIKEEASKIQMEKKYNFAEGEGGSYPWDECIADQTARYGDEETAKKVCGYIKSEYGS
jgi:hypothetical protein